MQATIEMPLKKIQSDSAKEIAKSVLDVSKICLYLNAISDQYVKISSVTKFLLKEYFNLAI